jgi:hypothetical protein
VGQVTARGNLSGGSNLILVLLTWRVVATLKGACPVPARRLVHGLGSDHRVSVVDRAVTTGFSARNGRPCKGA